MNCTKFSENTQKTINNKKSTILKSRHFKEKRLSDKENQNNVDTEA